MKKLLSVLLAVCLLCSIAALPALAAEDDYTGKTVILATGNLRGDVDLYPRIAAVKKAYEARGADVILADTGNYLQGYAAANTDMGLTIYNLMDTAGYDVAAMGLAEFSYGPATTGMPYHNNLTRYYAQAELQNGAAELRYKQGNSESAAELTRPAKEPAKFQTVASNVTANASYYSFEDHTVVETSSGLKIAFFGVTDPMAKDSVQDGCISEIAAPAVMRADGADLNVCLCNAPGWAGISRIADLVISALPGGTETVGAYVIDNETLDAHYEDVALTAADPDVAALAEAAKANAAPVLGTSGVVLNGADSVGWNGESNLGDFVTDALRWYAENYVDGWDRTLPLVAIQNGGNCDQFLYDGDITETDLLRALPFSPMGVGVLEVTGAQLLETLEAASQVPDCPGFAQVSGLRYTLDLNEDYDGGAAYGKFFEADSVNRVAITEINGADFDPEARYALVADNYILNGNDTYYTLKAAKDAGAACVNNGTGVRVRDVAALYIQNVLDGMLGTDYAEPQGRITVLEKSAANASVARAAAVSALYDLAGSPDVVGIKNPFTDVREGVDGYDAILWAVNNGITNGVDAARFAPERTITREQAATLVYRYIQSTGGGFTGAWMFLLDYPDREEISDWAYEALCYMTMNGLLTALDGGALSPKAPCTAAQLAALLEGVHA